MSSKSLSAILILLLVSFSSALFGQKNHYNFLKLTSDNGLSDNHVTSVFVDSSGFSWFGTNSGLTRYDGYRCKVFLHSPNDSSTLRDNFVFKIFELPGNRMYISSNDDFGDIFNPQSEEFDHNVQRYFTRIGLPGGRVIDIRKDTHGVFWFLFAGNGLFRYDPALKTSKKFILPIRSASSQIDAISLDGNDNIWMVLNNGLLLKVNSITGKPMFQSSQLINSANEVTEDFRLFADSKGRIWCYLDGESKGLFCVDPFLMKTTHFQNMNSPFRLNDNVIQGIVEDKGGGLWVATDHGGVNIIDGKNFSNIEYLVSKDNDPGSLSYNRVECIFSDNRGIIWIGTGKKGLNYLNQNIPRFELYRHESYNTSTLPYNDVNCFAEDKSGDIWIGTNGGGLLKFEPNTGKFFKYLNNPRDPNSLTSNIIVSLCTAKNGKLWIGTYLGGMDEFDGKDFHHFKNDPENNRSISDDRIWSIEEDPDGGLWIGTLRKGLDHFNPATGAFTHYSQNNKEPFKLANNYVPTIRRTAKGEIWIGTSEGIDVLNGKKRGFTFYTHSADSGSLSYQNVIHIIQDRSANIWVATRIGLNLYDPNENRFQRITTEDGLPDNTITGVMADNDNNLWVATPKGLCQLVIEKMFPKLTFKIRNFSESNNMQGKTFNERAIFLSSAGKIFVGGPNGFNLIDPEKIKEEKSRGSLVITGIEVFNNEYNNNEELSRNVIFKKIRGFGKPVNLNYNENIFSIEFAVLDFLRTAQFAYKLEGYDKNWIYTGTDARKVNYTNIEPGTYTFRVKTTNSDGTWNNNEKTVTIIVAPPFWKSTPAFAVYGLLVCCAIWFARRLTLERARMRFEVELQRKEAERMLALDNVKTKFFTNVSHEFRTPLSLILAPLDKLIQQAAPQDQKRQLQTVQRNARRLLNLVNQLLDFRKMEVQDFKLQPTEGDLVKLIREAVLSFSDMSELRNINCTFSSDREKLVTLFDRDKMEKIFFNLLSNAFKYTRPYGFIRVVLHDCLALSKSHDLEIRIEDSGIGIPEDKQDRIFERFFQNDIPDNVSNPGTGIGLAITREFVKLHGGEITVNSEPNRGSTFILRFSFQNIDAGNVIPENEEIQTVQVFSPVNEQQKETNSKKLPLILLVDDNDDFRFYLKDNLKGYSVVEAVDGQDAIDKLLGLKPDLIVSDVMMPNLDGIELTKRVKSGPLQRTPIILLTAVGNEELQLESYRLGVSDYITKPFTFEILESRIKLILAQKPGSRNFAKFVSPETSVFTVEPADETFVKQVVAIVEKHLSEPDFSVEELSENVNMHRAAIYRKLLNITGMSPLEFIRHIRLDKGKQLLEKSQLNISEIAYEVGFNNPKKFSQYFKEQYGVTPSQYQKKSSAEIKS